MNITTTISNMLAHEDAPFIAILATGIILYKTQFYLPVVILLSTACTVLLLNNTQKHKQKEEQKT